MGILTLTIITCSSPMSKDSYLEKFTEFISEVKIENSNYNKKDWKEKDKKYTKFTDEWYNKFKDELTWKEQIAIKKYCFQYQLIKTKGIAGNYFDNYLKSDYKNLKKQVQYYVENDMQDDIDLIIKQAEEAGESATEALKDILEEVENELNKTQK